MYLLLTKIMQQVNGLMDAAGQRVNGWVPYISGVHITHVYTIVVTDASTAVGVTVKVGPGSKQAEKTPKAEIPNAETLTGQNPVLSEQSP